jgi:hypothetical protein
MFSSTDGLKQINKNVGKNKKEMVKNETIEQFRK